MTPATHKPVRPVRHMRHVRPVHRTPHTAHTEEMAMSFRTIVPIAAPRHDDGTKKPVHHRKPAPKPVAKKPVPRRRPIR